MSEEIDRMLKEHVARFEQRYDAMEQAYERAIEASLQAQRRKLSHTRPKPRPLLRRVQLACGQTLVRMGNHLLSETSAGKPTVIVLDTAGKSAARDWAIPQYSFASGVSVLEEEE
jgi:hypothetical protein